MSGTFLDICQEEAQRLGHGAAPQLAGFTLRRGRRHPRSSWEGRAGERALLGYLVERTLAMHRSDGGGVGVELAHLPVWRAGERVSRLEDLAHTLKQGRRDARSLQGLCARQTGAALEARHVRAVEGALAKTSQRKNLSRLFALAERLDALLSDRQGRALLQELNDAFEARWGLPRLVLWSLCSRFTPLCFTGGPFKTKLVIASLYMGERALCDHTNLGADEARRLRISLIVALRRLNQSMGWTDVRDAFPERLVMTQRDLKSRRDPDDSDPGAGMLADLRALATRSIPTPGDDLLWRAMMEDAELFERYLQFRHAFEERAEQTSNTNPARPMAPILDALSQWWRVGLLGAAGVALSLSFCTSVHTPPPTPVAPPMLGDDFLGRRTRQSMQWSRAMIDQSRRSLLLTTTTVAAFFSGLPSPLLHAEERPPQKPTPPPSKPTSAWSSASDARLRVEMLSGDVELMAHSGASIEHRYEVIEGEPKTCRVVSKASGKTRVLKQETEGSGTCQVRMWIRVPAKMRVALRMAKGKLVATGLRGRLDLKVSAGSVRLQKMNTPELRATMSKGDFIVSGKVKRTDVTLGMGRAQVDLDATPKDGSVRIALGSGNAMVKLPPTAKITTDLTNIKGSVLNTFTPDPDATFHVKVTTTKGLIRVDSK